MLPFPQNSKCESGFHGLQRITTWITMYITWKSMAYLELPGTTWNTLNNSAYLGIHIFMWNAKEYHGIQCNNAMAHHGILGGAYLFILFLHSLGKHGEWGTNTPCSFHYMTFHDIVHAMYQYSMFFSLHDIPWYCTCHAMYQYSVFFSLHDISWYCTCHAMYQYCVFFSLHDIPWYCTCHAMYNGGKGRNNNFLVFLKHKQS